MLRTSKMNLMDRLALHVKSDVALQAEGYSGQPGELQKVGKRFIRVGGHHYVPSSLQEIVLLGASGRQKASDAPQAIIHTTYMGSFTAAFIRNGADFIEIAVSRADEEEELAILIPLNKIIGIESV